MISLIFFFDSVAMHLATYVISLVPIENIFHFDEKTQNSFVKSQFIEEPWKIVKQI